MEVLPCRGIIRSVGGAKALKIAMKHHVNRVQSSKNFALSGSDKHLNLENCHRLPFASLENDLQIL